MQNFGLHLWQDPFSLSFIGSMTYYHLLLLCCFLVLGSMFQFMQVLVNMMAESEASVMIFEQTLLLSFFMTLTVIKYNPNFATINSFFKSKQKFVEINDGLKCCGTILQIDYEYSLVVIVVIMLIEFWNLMFLKDHDIPLRSHEWCFAVLFWYFSLIHIY